MPDVLFVGDGPKTALRCAVAAAFRYNHGDRGDGGTVWTRAKLLQFVENYRPAYYGTWRRRSLAISGRRPFAKDSVQLDYEVDSDDEWEEEEPGESITQSDEEEEGVEEDDEEDEENEFLVPHGYLSDDEGVDVDANDNKKCDGESLELKKLRQRLSLAEYEMAHKRGLQKLKSLLLGPIWLNEPIVGLLNSSANEADTCWMNADWRPEEDKENVPVLDPTTTVKEAISKRSPDSPVAEHRLAHFVLNAYRVYLWHDQLPIVMAENDEPMQSVLSRRRKKLFPTEAVPYLIHLVHRNILGKAKLAFEFQTFWQFKTTGKMPDCCSFGDQKEQQLADGLMLTPSEQESLILTSNLTENISLSKVQVVSKIREIAAFEDNRWVVRPEVLRENVGSDLDADFNFPPWNYVTDVCAKSQRGFARKRALTSIEASAPPLSLNPASDGACASSHKEVPAVSKNELPSEISNGSKRRTTLETFFTPPPAKRKKLMKTTDTTTPKVTSRSSDPIIIID